MSKIDWQYISIVSAIFLAALALSYSIHGRDEPTEVEHHPPIETAFSEAAIGVCHDLLLMWESGNNSAIESLGLVRCALLEEMRAQRRSQ